MPTSPDTPPDDPPPGRVGKLLDRCFHYLERLLELVKKYSNQIDFILKRGHSILNRSISLLKRLCYLGMVLVLMYKVFTGIDTEELFKYFGPALKKSQSLFTGLSGDRDAPSKQRSKRRPTDLPSPSL